MQINTRAAHDAQVGGMAALQRRIDTLQSQIATGKRLAAPSDDPVASGIATRLRRTQASGAAGLRVADAAASRLNAADAALGSVATLLIRARELALAGASATLNAGDRATLASEAAGIGDQLMAFANTRAPDGTPLFGGVRGTGDAFARDAGGKVVWAGSGGAPTVTLGGSVVASGIAGPDAFTGPDADAFALIDDLQAALAAPDATRAADLATVLTGLDAAVSRTADARAQTGRLGERLDAEAARMNADDLRLETDAGKLEGTDLATAIAQLQRLTTVLQAAQASFVKVASLSLWDRL